MTGKILIAAAVAVCAVLSSAACGRSARQNSMNTVSIQSIKIEHEGWVRDQSVQEPQEPTYQDPAS